MIRLLLLPLIILTSLCTAGTQIILTYENVPHSPSYVDIRYTSDVELILPAHGEDKVYNYSAAMVTDADTVPYMPAVRAGFELFTRFNNGVSSVGTLGLNNEFYTHKNETGVFFSGSHKLAEKFTLFNITGNIGDTLEFPGSNSLFGEAGYVLKFPASYGDNWTSYYQSTTDFNLSVASFGLVKAPGNLKQDVQDQVEVVGWGEIILPTANGPSMPIEVLLTQTTRIYVDSIFLNGQPAPALLLAAFGMSQGKVSMQNEYQFHAAGFERPLMVIEMSDSWQLAENFYFNLDGVVSTGVDDEYKNAEIRVYPNPATRASILTFEMNIPFETVHLNMYDLTGQHVWNQRLYSEGSGILSWQIPLSIQEGSYFYTLTNDLKIPMASGKLNIH